MSSTDSSSTLFDATLRALLTPVLLYLDDETVSEILINGPAEIYIERFGRLQKVAETFSSAGALEAAARNIAQYVGKRLVPDHLSVEARLPDGSRIHILQPPAARQGICIAIRKFARSRLELDALVSQGALSAIAADYLAGCVRARKNVIVSGGTGSGKTTILNCLSSFIDADERILVLEDSTELQLRQPHVLQLEAQLPDRNAKGGISIRELFRASLRMRPDRIVIGECRGGEALDMIQAMTSGHSGSLSTCHASSPVDAMARLETMALMADAGLPLVALRRQLASAVDVIVQAARLSDGTRRILEIAEVDGLDSAGEYEVRALFCMDSTQGRQSELVWTGRKSCLASRIRSHMLPDELSRCSEFIAMNG